MDFAEFQLETLSRFFRTTVIECFLAINFWRFFPNFDLIRLHNKFCCHCKNDSTFFRISSFFETKRNFQTIYSVVKETLRILSQFLTFTMCICTKQCESMSEVRLTACTQSTTLDMIRGVYDPAIQGVLTLSPPLKMSLLT